MSSAAFFQLVASIWTKTGCIVVGLKPPIDPKIDNHRPSPYPKLISQSKDMSYL